MTTLAVAYGVAFAAVAAFLARLKFDHRRLSGRLDAVEAAMHEQTAATPARRAA